MLDTLIQITQNKWFVVAVDIVIFTVLIKASNLFIEKFIEKICAYKDDYEVRKQLATLKFVIKSVTDTVLVAFAVMYIFNKLGIDIRPILAAAGVLGVAVGFGAKRFFEDIITGVSILLEGQVRVGDVVDISGHVGTVEKADIRLIQLRDIEGRVHFIRNGMIDIIVNYTRDYSYYVFDIGVGYGEDMDNVIEVLKKLDDEFQQNYENKDDILAPLEILGVDKLDDSAVIVKARMKTKPQKQWAIGRAFNKAIKKRFDEMGIEIPFPQTTIHVRPSNKNDEVN